MTFLFVYSKASLKGQNLNDSKGSMKLFFYLISLQCRRPWMVCLFPHSWALLGEVELQLYGVKSKKSCARVSRVAFTVGPSSQDPIPQQKILNTPTLLYDRLGRMSRSFDISITYVWP